MKFVHFADAHIGVSADSPMDHTSGLPGRVVDFLDSMDSMIDFAEDEQVDYIVFAGDMYHRCNPTPTIVREVSKRVVRMASICPTIIIPGNHDTPGPLDKANAVDIFSTLKVANVHVLSDYSVRLVGDLCVASCPMPVKRHLLTSLEMRQQANDAIFKQRIKDVVYHLLERKVSSPFILIGHFSLDGAVYGSERGMTIGDDADVNLSWLAEWDYVALGHIHKHQVIGNAVYPGSLDRVDFNEELDLKGFMLVTMDSSAVSHEFIVVDARPWVTIDVDTTDTKHPTSKVLKHIHSTDMQDAVVRVLIAAEHKRAASIDRAAILDALRESGAWQVTSIQIKERQIERFARLTDEPIASMSPQELVATYFQSVGVRDKALLKLADTIIRDVNNG